MPEVKHPNVKVKLVGEDGNACSIMGRVSKAMRRAGCTPEQIKEYTDAATSGDYNNLLNVTQEYVDCDPPEEKECGYCGLPMDVCDCDEDLDP